MRRIDEMDWNQKKLIDLNVHVVDIGLFRLDFKVFQNIF